MKIIIVDDDSLVLKSLELMLSKEDDIEVIGTASNGQQAFELCENNQPQVVLMDIRMPEVDGIQATRLIKKKYPHIRVMMLTTFQDKQNIQLALQAGAEGYLLKTEKISNIAEKLRIISSGVAILDTEVLTKLTSIETPNMEKLTPREKEVVDLVSQGLTNKEISQQLFLSEGTVRNIVSVVIEKMEVKNRTQLSIVARN